MKRINDIQQMTSKSQVINPAELNKIKGGTSEPPPFGLPEPPPWGN